MDHDALNAVRHADTFSYTVGGYEMTNGRHYDVENGDPALTAGKLPRVDYASVYIEELDRWFHVDGPFNDWEHLDAAIWNVLDAY